MFKKKASPVRALIDLKNRSPTSGKKTSKKVEKPDLLNTHKSKSLTQLVPIEFEARGERWVVEVDPRRNIQSILKEVTSRSQFAHTDREHLRSQLLKQLQKTSSQKKLQQNIESEPESPNATEQEADIIELTGSDIRFLRTVFDAIGSTSHGSILYEDRGCQQLAKCLPPDHQHAIKQIVMTLLHRRQPARFEDFIFLVCEEGRLETLQNIFIELLR